MNQTPSSLLEEDIGELLVSKDRLECNYCEKTFSTHGNLKNHIEGIHKKNRPYKCFFPDCTKSYCNHSRLTVHQRTHSGIKPYKCSECDKSFNEKGNLKTHMCFHSEEKPFQCKLCEKKYKTNGHLKDHIEIHHKSLRKYDCALCNQKFGRSSTLKAHMRIHTGEKNYACPIDKCEKVFAEKGNMVIHYKRHLKRLNKDNDCNNVTRPNSSDVLALQETKDIPPQHNNNLNNIEMIYQIMDLPNDNKNNHSSDLSDNSLL